MKDFFTFSDQETSQNRIKTSETKGCVWREQRVYGTHEFGARKRIVSSSLLIRGENDEEEDIWVGKVLLMYRSVVAQDEESDEMAFVQCLECVMPLNPVIDMLECVFLPWSAAEAKENDTAADRFERENSRTAASELFEVTLFEISLSAVRTA